jgi:hypothetical protein
MSLRAVGNLLLLFFFANVQAKSQQKGFDKPAFYSALASANTADLDAQLRLVREAGFSEKEAYEGALLMKKAELAGKAKDKLNFFKAGRLKLESSIFKNVDNIEYRFLRLIIQEHAPKIVKYRKELEEDSRMIRSNLKELPPTLQHIIIDYSKKSTVLKTD